MYYPKNFSLRRSISLGRKLTKEELIDHKNRAIRSLDDYMQSLIDSSDEKTNGKSDKLSYWIEDWSKFLNFENNFSPSSLKRYKRGEIVKAHLGYNVGSEEGGLHYCAVLDKNNPQKSPVITVVPLTSLKSKTDITRLHKGNVYLEDELYLSLGAKIDSTQTKLTDKLTELKESIKENGKSKIPNLEDQIISAKNQLEFCKRMYNEIQKMKVGSIALTNQIRTISKIRIYDPKTNHDILSGIKLSSEKLDLIDTAILQQLIGKK